MKRIMLFTDASLNSKSKEGFGAYLFTYEQEPSLDLLKDKVKVKQFGETSSTKIELQTFLWALNNINCYDCKITVYTDSQNLVSLPGRRKRLEQCGFHSSKNQLIKNHLLYKEFYKITDEIDCKFVKVNGHKKTKLKDKIDNLFTLVDRASRKALRRISL